MKKLLILLATFYGTLALAEPDSTKAVKAEKRLKQFTLLSPISTFRVFVTIDLDKVGYYSKASLETTLVGAGGEEVEIVYTYEDFDKLMRRK